MIPESAYVHDWVRAHAADRPDAPAIGMPERPWVSYRELQARIDALVVRFARLGMGKGSFGIVSLPASDVSVAAALAMQTLGGVCIDINREAGKDTFAEVLRQTEATVACVLLRDVPTWAGLAADRPGLTLVVVHPEPPPARAEQVLAHTAWEWLPTHGPDDPADPATDALRAELTPDDMALLVYTSGSTGTPRAVIQTHGNIDANTRAIVRYLELTERDRAMATLPLFYCYGRSVLQTHLLVGGSVFFDHRFMYPAVVMKELQEQSCTGFAGVPLTFENLRRQLDIASMSFPTLRYVTQAGGAMHPDTIRWARQAFAPAVLFVMYGQTEATSRLAYLHPADAERKEGSVGKILDNLELRIVDDAGNPLPPGVDGHVTVRGPSVTPGYFKAPQETAEILRDGWLYTGDLGHVDDEGYLYLTGRTKEFLKLGGNRVSAREIEEVLRRHDQVRDVAVVGIVDTEGAEQAVAVVVREDGTDLDEAGLRRWSRERLPAFKVPRFVRFVDALPTTSSGKVARSELQEWIKHDATLQQAGPRTGSGGEGG